MLNLLVSAIISGVAAGGIYALIGVGITQIFKVTRVINFAHAGFVLWGAYLYGEYTTTANLPVVGAALLTVASVAAMGVIAEFVVFRIGARATNVNKIILTFGLLQMMTALSIWVWGQFPYQGNVLIPAGGLSIFGTQVAWHQFANIGFALLVVIGMGAFLKLTRIGLLTRAVAEDATMAEMLGARRQRIGSLNWAIGAAIGGLAGILVANTGPFTNDIFLTYFTIALLAPLLGGLQSLPLTVVGALIVGVIDNIAGSELTSLNAPDAVLFACLAAFVILKRKWPAELSRISWTKPTVVLDGAPAWTIFYQNMIVFAAAWIALIIYAISQMVWAQTGGLILIYAIAALSMVPVLGWTGQISLAQGGFMGIGAFTMASAEYYYNVPLLLAILLAIGVGVGFGALLGMVTGRLSFVLTAIVTLQFTNGMAWLLNSPALRAVSSSIDVVVPDFLGTALRQFIMFGICGIVVALLLSNLKRSPWGVRFLATKTRPVMAQHFGVQPFQVRVYSFAISGGIASLAGCLYGMTIGVANVPDFSVGMSLTVLQYAVLGGMGAVWGPFVATLGFVGLPQLLNLNRFGALPWPNLLGGAGVIQVMSVSEDGITGMAKPPTHKLPGTKFGRMLAEKLHYMPITLTGDISAQTAVPAHLRSRVEEGALSSGG